jgi:hypothetical protein
MSKVIKVLKHIPGVRAIFRFARQYRLKCSLPKKIFTEYYKKNTWKGGESRSGEGSSLKETETLRQALPALFNKYSIKTILDMPCGDYHWMPHLDYAFDHYIGADIVDEMIVSNQVEFGNTTTDFRVIDCMHDPLPRADAIFCRDLLVHLSYLNIEQFLKNIKKSNIRYLLTTHFCKTDQNKDILTGKWRPINLTLAPFLFPKPKEILLEKSMEREGRDLANKTMGLWEIKHLPSALMLADVPQACNSRVF